MKPRAIALTAVSGALGLVILPLYTGYVISWLNRTGVFNPFPTIEWLGFVAPIAILAGLWLVLVIVPKAREAKKKPASTPPLHPRRPARPKSRIIGTTADGQVVEQTGFNQYRKTPVEQFRRPPPRP